MEIVEDVKGALRRIENAVHARAAQIESRLMAGRIWLVACALCLAFGAALGRWVR